MPYQPKSLTQTIYSMKKIEIKLIDGKVPTKGSEYAAAYDIYVPKDTILVSGRQVIPTGFMIALPPYWSADIRPRSGFSVRGMEVYVRTTYTDGMTPPFVVEEKMNIDADVLLGLIDSDYRNEVGVMVINRQKFVTAEAKTYHSYTIIDNEYIIKKDTRIAQMKIDSLGEREYVFEVVDELDKTIDRGGGYGHTGA